MKVEDEYLDVLQNIETAVIAAYDKDPGLLDLDVIEAFETLIRRYTLEERGRLPGNERISARAKEVFDLVQQMCEWRLGRGSIFRADTDQAIAAPEPIAVGEMLLCLKRLRKSASRWSREGGRQGYLNYVRQFIAGMQGGQ